MSCCTTDDGPEFMTEKRVTARSAHKCCECGYTIQPGEAYEYVAGRWDGSFNTFKTCERCADLRESLGEIGCPSYGGLFEEYSDHVYDHEKAGEVSLRHRLYGYDWN